MKKFYITTPIYYVNDKPHIGHSYTTILADVLSRYHRLFGDDVYFLTGTDEHGQKVQKAAESRAVPPLEHCEEMVKRYRQLWKKLEITNDDFIRTTEDRHKNVVRSILSDLYGRGLIYKADYKGRYCVPCERFFTEKDLASDCGCPECARPTDEISESNYFFKMSLYQDWLIEHINANPGFIQPDFRRNETLGFLRKKLEDLCISRPKKRLSWGIALPFDDDYVCYVWFDALINYISAIGYGSDPKKFAKYWPASCHLIGKDILTTHTVYWPIMLKAIGVEPPEMIFAHGWWLSGADKMSKSMGNVVDPMAMIDSYGVDPFRYFLMSEMVLGGDATFSEEAFVTRYNSDLANDLGNLVSRVIKMIVKNAGGLVPAPGPMTEDDRALADAATEAALQTANLVNQMKIDKAIAAIFAVVRHANKYFESAAPWNLAKNQDPRLDTVLYCAAEALRIISGLLLPVMPAKMREIRAAIGLSPDEKVMIDDLCRWALIKPGSRVKDIASLFPRVESKRESRHKDADVKKTAPCAESGGDAGLVSIDDFAKVKLRVAKVVLAERVEGSDKLLRLEIEIGSEKRQIVAGIARSYAPEQIIGRSVVVVSNLKPAKIRGVESRGMLLAAKSGDRLRIITVDGDIPSGADVS